MKVYVVQELDMNGEPGSIVGICSSKEKGQLAIEARISNTSYNENYLRRLFLYG